MGGGEGRGACASRDSATPFCFRCFAAVVAHVFPPPPPSFSLSSGHLYLQTELCEGGSLAAVLQALPAGSLLPEGDVWKLAAELGDGLAHCHAHGVTHLDVKPSNVFLDAHAAAKLGDFGLALLAGRGWGVEEGDGAYCAPELLAADPLPGPHSDVYSLGATLVEAACGAPPPRGGRAGPLVLPGARSPQLVATLEACLHPDPHQRPSAEDVCLEACRVLGRPRHRGTS